MLLNRISSPTLLLLHATVDDSSERTITSIAFRLNAVFCRWMMLVYLRLFRMNSNEREKHLESYEKSYAKFSCNHQNLAFVHRNVLTYPKYVH